MRENWTETTLGEAVSIQKGKKPPALVSSGEFCRPYLTAEVLRGATCGQFVPEEHVGPCVRLNGHETVLLWDGAGAGDVFRAQPGVLASTMAKLETQNSNSIDDGYLFLYVNLKQAAIKSSCRGTTVPHVAPEALKSLSVSLPPLAQQKRIVDLFSSVDSYIAALQQQADAARSARSAVLSELLSAGGDDWAETTLGKVAHWQGGITPSMANRSFWEGGTIPWISSGDVLQLSQYGAGKYVTEASLRETSLKLLPIGTIVVVVRSGILAHTLPVALLDTPSTINQDIKAGLPQSGVLGEFLMWFLRSNSQSILESCRKTGTTVQSVSTDAFLRFQVSLPPTKEQERIVAIVSSMEEVIKSADKVVADAKSLRSGLLSDLLSGSHEIPESYDRLLGAA